ncbi:MAG: TatD family hydrolase [Acidilobus sp.]
MMEEVYYDIHCHLAEFSDEEVERMLAAMPGLKIVAVSEDLKSFDRTLDLSQRFRGRVIACAGFHPWSIRDHPIDEAWQLLRLAQREGVQCIGEVGLDRKFLPEETFGTQRRIFQAFAEAARDLDALLNIHSPGAWREALSLVTEIGVRRAVFHWYTGPLDLIGQIAGRGYFISVNAAAKVQGKSIEVAKAAPLEAIVLESDGPYEYHGLRLTPLMIPDLVKLVAQVKQIDHETAMRAFAHNSERALKLGR